MTEKNGSSWKPQFGVLNGGVRPPSAFSPRVGKMVQALKSFAEEGASRFDAWVNEVTGFGTSRDKTTYGYILPTRLLTDDELSSLYHSDDMAARMVDIVPQEMLREPFDIETGDPDLDAAIADKMEHLGVREKMADGIRWARAFGGAALLIGADDGREAIKELNPDRVKDISYLYVIDRRYLWPVTWYDEPGHPKLGQVKTFLVTTQGGTVYSTAEVHESRLILFHGAPTGTREKFLFRGWSLPVLQRAADVLRQFNTGWQAVETMMTDGSQAVFKISGLTEMLAADGGRAMLSARMQAMDLYRSVMRAIVIDADAKEEFERQSASFAEIPQTLDKFMLRLAASVEIPVTILMGQSPAGMNATGESDFRWFYDRIRAQQTTMLAPRIRTLVSIWLRTRVGREASRGKEPEQLNVKFPPLWTETPLAEAQRIQAMSTTDASNVNAQIFTPEEVALVRGRPDGYASAIVLTEESIKLREQALASQGSDEPTGDEMLGGGASTAEVDETSKLVLTATDLAAITKVNEARTSVGLSPIAGADGQLTIPAFKAKYAAVIATSAAADAGQLEPADAASQSALASPSNKSPDEPPDGAPPEDDAPADEEVGRPAFFKVDALRPFELHRDVDETGVSGTGIVAEGCVFSDGTTAMRWRTATAATTIFKSIEDAMKVHGHGGLSRVVYLDEKKP